MTDPRRFRSRVFLCVYVGLFLFAIVAGMMIHSGPNSAGRVRLNMDTNGVASLAGFRLTNPTLRHGIFKSLHALGLKVGVGMPQMSPSFANSAQATNFINTFKEISQAGLFETSR